jgi:integrase
LELTKKEANMVAKVITMVEVSTDWRAEFRAWDVRKGGSANTVESHQCDLNVWCKWFVEATGYEFTPELLNSFDLGRFRQWSLDVAGVRPATWNRRLATLRVLTQWMKEKTEIRVAEDLFDGITMKDEVALPPEWLTDIEFSKLGRWIESVNYEGNTVLRQLRALRARTMTGIMVYAGLREAEVANLLVSDVTLGERKVWITVRKGKGDKAREVPVGTALLKVLRRWMDAAKPTGFLFEVDGGGISERAMQEQMQETGALLGIADFRAHRLRHTFCKRLADASVPLDKIASLAGHASMEVTRRYTQPGREDLEGVVDLVTMGKMAKRS